jgi:glycosyltransferase involved in cell wall biosynthesis
MPVSVLECIASGLPVIATRVGGIPYILETEHTGLLVDRDDHRGMANSAFRLLEEDGLAARLIRNAREECRKYTPPVVAREWIDLYAHVAASADPDTVTDPHNPRSVLT